MDWLASHLSLLPADKLPSTAPYGLMGAALANIQFSLKEGDEGLWYGVLPSTIHNWIRKVETVSEQYRNQELKKLENTLALIRPSVKVQGVQSVC